MDNFYKLQLVYMIARAFCVLKCFVFGHLQCHCPVFLASCIFIVLLCHCHIFHIIITHWMA